MNIILILATGRSVFIFVPMMRYSQDMLAELA